MKGHFRKLLERIMERARIFISIVYLESQIVRGSKRIEHNGIFNSADDSTILSLGSPSLESFIVERLGGSQIEQNIIAEFFVSFEIFRQLLGNIEESDGTRRKVVQAELGIRDVGETVITGENEDNGAASGGDSGSGSVFIQNTIKVFQSQRFLKLGFRSTDNESHSGVETVTNRSRGLFSGD
jgi:hypothetical protein